MAKKQGAKSGRKPTSDTATSKAAPKKKAAKKKTTTRRGPSRARKVKDQTGLTKPQQLFLEAYRKRGVLAQAAYEAGVTRRVHYKWLKASQAYAEAFAEADEDARDLLVSEARRRAVEGTRKLVLYRGEPVQIKNPKTGEIETYYEREYSDQLLVRLLQAKVPGFSHKHEHSGPGGKAIQHQVINLDRVTDEQLEALEALAVQEGDTDDD